MVRIPRCGRGNLSSNLSTDTFFLVISQLLSLDDVNVKLIIYLRDTQKEKICTDAIYIFESVFSKRNECKELFTQDFIMSLFELIDLIEDDLNFESAVKILMLSEHNNFVKVYHIHRNARVFNEILIRLNNILDNEKDNILYTTDIESLIDIIIIKLQIAESKLMPFIIDIIEKITNYPEYYKTMYKIDELLNLFEDFAYNNTVEELVKLKSKKIIEQLSQSKKEKL